MDTTGQPRLLEGHEWVSPTRVPAFQEHSGLSDHAWETSAGQDNGFTFLEYGQDASANVHIQAVGELSVSVQTACQ